jgi:hypothetical protein
MNHLLSLSVLLAVLAGNVVSAEEISGDFTSEGSHRTDFSNMSRGPLKVGDFSDSRTGIESNVLSDGYTLDRPLADVVRSALVQGLEKGGASLANEGENMSLIGSIVSTEAQIVDDNGMESIQLTVRTRVQLQGSGRTMWETVLFGRGTAPAAEGMAQALANALDRTIRGLVQDDYFLIEVL